ncbi:hypothetical protein HN51_012375 [Arachis hypogaea]
MHSGAFVSKFVNLDLKSYIRFLNWMPAALQMPKPELIDHAGLDSAVYLRIYLLGIKIFVPIAFLVLTLEYVPGLYLDLWLLFFKSNEIGMLYNILSQCMVYDTVTCGTGIKKNQIVKTGFFHLDPHPGNLAIDVDEALIYYDFGMMGEIKSFTRERLLELFYAVYKKDAKKVLNSYTCCLVR